MIKKVDVEDLRPGVFVHDFDEGWFRHPFIGNKKLLKNEWMIERIRKYGITELYIDTSKGLDVRQKSVSMDEWKTAFAGSEELQKKLILERTPWAPLEQEMERAVEIKAKARDYITQLNNDAKLGKEVSVNQAEDIVDDMLGSLARNKDAFLSLISIKNKDEYTFNHSINVSVLMASFCKSMGMDADKIRVYATGAIFHDVGKTMIPEEILNKPSDLSAQEYEMMKQHPALGREILSKAKNIDSEMIDVVYEHHEKMNGKGYPNGLEGHNISLGGRLAGIVDTYDALVSDRVYKKADSPTNVLKHLFKSTPSDFDFELLQKFIHSIGIYPLGSLIRLSSGFLAIVVESPRGSLVQPVVLLVYDTNKERAIPVRKLDLSQGVGEIHQIVGTEDPESWKIDIAEHMKLD